MLKIIIGGIVVGMANIIPGVSGGTMMAIFGLFNPVMEAISSLTSFKSKDKMSHIKFLCTLLIGVAVGLVVFSKIVEYSFNHIPTQTLFCFFGMILFSIPILKRKEMSEDKFAIIPFLIGIIAIGAMVYFSPVEAEVVITDFPAITTGYLIKMILIGIVAGAAMFIPGVSGSMLLLILGEYYLFNSLISNVTTFELNVLIPLAFIGAGIFTGIILSSKVTGYALKTNHQATMNFIMGLIVASLVMIVPFDASLDFNTIVTSIIAVILGGASVVLLEKFVR